MTAKYYTRTLKPGVQAYPPIAPLTALAPMAGARVGAVERAQDAALSTARRVVLAMGHGEGEWLAGTSAPYPRDTVARVVGRSRVRLTPGCFLRLDALVLPSGTTQDGGAVAVAPRGTITVEVEWTDAVGATATTSHAVELPASGLASGGEPTAAGGSWSAVRTVQIPDIRPSGLGSAVVLRRWSRYPATATITVSHTGGVRVVDLAITEEPYAIAIEADDDGGSMWPGQVLDAGSVTPTWPWQRYSETTPDGDPRGGTLHALDVAASYARATGPMILAWSAYSEAGTAPADAEPPPVTTTSASYVDLITGTGDYDPAVPGWHCGSYALDYVLAGDRLGLRGVDGAIPVRVAVYAQHSAGTGEVRVQTDTHSLVDVAVSSTTYAWHEAYGYLRCGVSPDDATHLQVLLRSIGGGTLSVRYVAVYYAAMTA